MELLSCGHTASLIFFFLFAIFFSYRKLEEENAVFESRLYKFESAEKENHVSSVDVIDASP